MSLLYSVCTINGTALKMSFDCVDPFTNATTREDVCNPDNPDIQNAFNDTGIFVNDDWIEGFRPVCRPGIPGITASRTIIGKMYSFCFIK